jgi:hypothetical protein
MLETMEIGEASWEEAWYCPFIFININLFPTKIQDNKKYENQIKLC